ncbi:hypothetical protein LCGC14_0645380 [marine sediment metagenome]|uniref:Uncharacterized protein n=1 Tax=marine sediment metagenome TaxID=412755 RepID=A0A0F9RHH9_9ZZZZ
MGLRAFLHRQANRVFHPSYLPRWHYLGGERLELDEGPTAATLPEGTEIFEISAEGGNISYSINTLNANVNSSGWVPQNGGRIHGPLSNLTQLSLWGALGEIAHLLYYRESN